MIQKLNHNLKNRNYLIDVSINSMISLTPIQHIINKYFEH